MSSAGILMYPSSTTSPSSLNPDSFLDKSESGSGILLRLGVPNNNTRIERGTKYLNVPGRRDFGIREEQEEEEEDSPVEDEEDDESSGSGYDTDIDLKNDRRLRQKPRERDDIQTYLDACEELGTVCQTRVLHSLSEYVLNIKHRCIGPVGTRALALALSHNIHIEELNLADNGMGAEGAVYVCQMLVENDTIHDLSLAENRLTTNGAYAIGEMLRYNKGLGSLDISSNNFEDCDSEFLANGIQATETLKALNLSHNGLSIRGGTTFGLAMAVNFSLTHLDLSFNHIREKGGVAFIKGLEENSTVTSLNISHNGLGYEGALALGNLLKVNSSLKVIDISHNRITWAGAPLLCKGLKVNETLEVLRIGWNPLTTTGCIDILEAVASQGSGVSELDMQGICVIGEYEMLASAITRNRKFIYRHAGIVSHHDVLGERQKRKITPMQRVINYMKRTGIRPTELFRTMDKQVNKEISKDDMIMRLKKAGIDMKGYEVQDLIDQLERSASFSAEEGNINYKNVARSVQDQILQERFHKIKTREREKKLKMYHKDILKRGSLPPISDSSEGEGRAMAGSDLNTSMGHRSQSRLSMDSNFTKDERMSFAGSRRFVHSAVNQRGSSAGGRTTSERPGQHRDISPTASEMTVSMRRDGSRFNNSQITPLPGGLMDLAPTQMGMMLQNGQPPGKIMSMSKPLGSKAIAFGTNTKKKKKKKSKKDARKKKSK